jgi:hypothetical protein
MKVQWPSIGGLLLVVPGSLVLAGPGKMEPIGIVTEYAIIFPSLEVATYYDDNIFSQEDHTSSSYVAVLTPGLRVETDSDNGIHTYAVEMQAEQGLYLDSHDDDYLDRSIQAEYLYRPEENLSARLQAGYRYDHDDRGQGALEGDAAARIDEPDRYRVYAVDGEVSYGLARWDAARITLGAGYFDRNYLNHEEVNQDNDLTGKYLDALFRYAITPNTRLRLQGRASQYDYDVSPRDSSQYRIMTGVEWEATYQTTGMAQIGWQKKNFDSDLYEDAAQFAWELGVNWQPLSYSSVTLNTGNRFDESVNRTTYVDRTDLRLAWNHDWTSYISSHLRLGAERREYPGTERLDKLTFASIEGEYLFREWLNLGASYTHEVRDSNEDNLSYTDNIYRVDAYAAF